MADRIPGEVFYDQEAVGVAIHPGPSIGWQQIGALAPDEFYGHGQTPRLATLGAFMRRIAARPWALGLALTLLGAGAVFLKQSGFLVQVVLGAPIFEEFLKFGIALLLAFWMRWYVLRLPVALAVGAGFGWFEHLVTYLDEDGISYLWRLVFHSGATGLSMTTYHVLERMVDPFGRWASTLWATLIHYVNNSIAVLLTLVFAVDLGLVELIAASVSAGLAAATVAAMPLVFLLRHRLRRWVSRHAPASIPS